MPPSTPLSDAPSLDTGSTAASLTAPTDANIAVDIASIKDILETMRRGMQGMEGRMHSMEGRMHSMEGSMWAMRGDMQAMDNRMVEMDVRLTGRIDNVMTRLGQVELRYATYGF